MSEDEDLKKINECIFNLINEFDRYYQTVNLIVAIFCFLKSKENCPVRFHMIEPTLKYKDESKVLTPDLTLLTDGEPEGIVIEIKSSMTNNELVAKNEIKELKRYDNPLNGWRTSKSINSHAIVLAIHMMDSSRVRRYITEMIKSGDIVFERNFALWEWSQITSPKVGQSDGGFLIRTMMGRTGCEWLDNNDIFVPEKQIIIDYEQRKFIRQHPPVTYTMVNLWCDVFPELCSLSEEFSFVTIQQIIKVIEEYYSTSWLGISDNRLQIQITWIREALEKFCELNLAEKVVDSVDKYKIFFGKKLPKKDVKEYFITKICEREIKSEEEEKKVVEKGSLNNYLS